MRTLARRDAMQSGVALLCLSAVVYVVLTLVPLSSPGTVPLVLLLPMLPGLAGIGLLLAAASTHRTKRERLRELELEKRKAKGMGSLLGGEKLLYGPVYTEGTWITRFQEMDEADERRKRKRRGP